MNAQEINNLYAPAIEKCRINTGLTFNGHYFSRMPTSHAQELGTALPYLVEDDLALDRHRVAVEDWLHEHHVYIRKLPMSMCLDVSTRYSVENTGQRTMNPTIHHALVSAALAVAQ